MKIPITINGKKRTIKPVADLTTNEFIEFSKMEFKDPSESYIKYIAWQTGETFDNAFFAMTSKTVEKAIGIAPDITKLPVPEWVDRTKTIDTVGQRHQVEGCKLTGYELLVFCLAVSQARSNNMDEVEKLKASYEEMPFTEILPAGFFFFRNFNSGKRKELLSLAWRPVLIRTKVLDRLRVLKG